MRNSINETIGWSKVSTGGGNVMRANFKGCEMETDLGRTWMHVIRRDGESVSLKIIDWACEHAGHTSEDFTSDWTNGDWALVESSLK